jgi:hypothetical protein
MRLLGMRGVLGGADRRGDRPLPRPVRRVKRSPSRPAEGPGLIDPAETAHDSRGRTRDFVPDCRNLRLTLNINGEARQDGNTKDMVFSPEEQVAHVSYQLTLLAGDIFSTGTPEGFGAQPDRFLKVGDVI